MVTAQRLKFHTAFKGICTYPQGRICRVLVPSCKSLLYLLPLILDKIEAKNIEDHGNGDLRLRQQRSEIEATEI
jgi:hypothetical protein